MAVNDMTTTTLVRLRLAPGDKLVIPSQQALCALRYVLAARRAGDPDHAARLPARPGSGDRMRLVLPAAGQDQATANAARPLPGALGHHPPRNALISTNARHTVTVCPDTSTSHRVMISRA